MKFIEIRKYREREIEYSTGALFNILCGFTYNLSEKSNKNFLQNRKQHYTTALTSSLCLFLHSSNGMPSPSSTFAR